MISLTHWNRYFHYCWLSWRFFLNSYNIDYRLRYNSILVISSQVFVKVNFGPWTEWLYCSENCGIGTTTRTRSCFASETISCPAAGSCENKEKCVFETKPCQIQKCPTCSNFENYCDGHINTECKDSILDNGEIEVCIKYFEDD